MAGSSSARRERAAQGIVLVVGLLLVLLASRPAGAQDDVPGGGVFTRSPSSAALGSEVTVQSVTPCPAPSAELTASPSYSNPVVVVTIIRDGQSGHVHGDIVDLPPNAGAWTAKVLLEPGMGDYPPGTYRIEAVCEAYYGKSAPCTTSPCLPRTDGSTAYFRYDPQPFELCPSGQASCAPASSTTTSAPAPGATTSTTAGATTSTTAGSTTSISGGTTSSSVTIAPSAPAAPAGVASASEGPAGSSLTVGADGFAPGSSGEVLFASTPVKIGTFSADARGVVYLRVTIPTSATAGRHHVILRGTAPGGALREVAIPITVTSRGLARTGRGLDLTLIAGLALTGLGLTSVGRSLVRSSSSA